MTNFDFIKSWLNDSSYSYHYGNLSNKHNSLLSYRTVIGMKTLSKDNRQVMLVSEERFSNTTAKHIRDLSGLSCEKWELLFVPFEYETYYSEQYENNWKHTTEKLTESFITLLKSIRSRNLTIKANREDYVRVFSNFEKFLDYYSVNAPTVFNELREVYNKIKADPTGKIFKDEAKTIRLKAKKVLEDFEKKVLKNPLELFVASNPYGNLQYIKGIYYNDQHYVVITNKYCRVKFNSLELLLESLEKLINTKEVSELDMIYIDCYRVKKIVGQKVYIGCHTIPKRNLKLWYNIIKNGYLA